MRATPMASTTPCSNNGASPPRFRSSASTNPFSRALPTNQIETRIAARRASCCPFATTARVRMVAGSRTTGPSTATARPVRGSPAACPRPRQKSWCARPMMPLLARLAAPAASDGAASATSAPGDGGTRIWEPTPPLWPAQSQHERASSGA
jgi:hypothetical protein